MDRKAERQESVSELENIPVLRSAETRKEATPLETMAAFFKQLLPDEQRVLKILFNSTNALTVKGIRKQYAIGMAEKHPTVAVDTSTLAKLRKSKEQTNESIISQMRIFKDKQIEAFISDFNKRASEKAISYNRIKNILVGFEKQVLVRRRKIEHQRADEVWSLTPIFYKIYFTVMNGLTRKGGHNLVNLTPMEYDAYVLLTPESF